MDYQQQWYGQSDRAPSRATRRMDRDGGIGGAAAVMAVVVAALAVVIWLAGARDKDDMPSAQDINVQDAATPALPAGAMPSGSAIPVDN